MTVLMISPGYPAEMAFFTRGLGQAGVRVIGLGDQSQDALRPRPSRPWTTTCTPARWRPRTT